MSRPRDAFSNIDQNVATNMREYRERAGVSQDELAQRMSERGFGFTQATIWKIESGQRPVKISEAAALADALRMPSWTYLTTEPATSRHLLQLQHANRVAHETYSRIKDAAAAYIEAQANVVVAAREAQDAGITATEPWTSYLDIPPERAVITARVEWARDDEVALQTEDEVDAILQALRDRGHEPKLPRPEELEYGSGRSGIAGPA